MVPGGLAEAEAVSMVEEAFPRPVKRVSSGDSLIIEAFSIAFDGKSIS